MFSQLCHPISASQRLCEVVITITPLTDDETKASTAVTQLISDTQRLRDRAGTPRKYSDFKFRALVTEAKLTHGPFL